MAVGRSSQTKECWWNTCIASSMWTGFLSPLFGTNHSMFSVKQKYPPHCGASSHPEQLESEMIFARKYGRRDE